MSDTAFKALMLNRADDGKVSGAIETLSTDQLPDADTTIAVKYSSLNYKDGLIMNGRTKLVKDYPHIPGVDYVGVVEDCTSGRFQPGDEVICTGWRVGEVWWGGYAQRARAKSEWLVPLPKGLNMVQTMGLGTAGLTAMMALMDLEDHGLTPDVEGEVLVTGAAGGMGTMCIALLSNLGYKVCAETGREETHQYLKDLGAHSIISREELETPPKGPLVSGRWEGAIDNVGGVMLGNLLSALKPKASVAAVGNVAGWTFEASIMPFLVRGVNILGIDSVTCPPERRKTAWERLSQELPLDHFDDMVEIHPMGDLLELGAKILDGKVRGRAVIDLNA
ncbi:MDR family oxidoreductase [Magnetovibrio sp. PR-2]|uniref:MDR family oxidoreductase n=1 Tax=Magnetovibrio sp. PR-2 TaxID=3120356 RepID=UPI002FCE213C